MAQFPGSGVVDSGNPGTVVKYAFLDPNKLKQYASGQPTPVPSPQSPGGKMYLDLDSFKSSWYTTWWGIGLIGLAGYLGYRKFVAKK